MQYKKEEVREKIIAAAMEEFESAGYQRANILTISRNARVPIGNIYRYFKNKADLFSSIVKEPYENMRPTLYDLYEEVGAISDPVIHISTAIVNIFKKWEKELIILIDKSAGSAYEDFYHSLCDFVTTLFELGLYPQKSENDHILCETIAQGLLNGIVSIVKRRTGDTPILMQRLIFYYTNRIKERLL